MIQDAPNPLSIIDQDYDYLELPDKFKPPRFNPLDQYNWNDKPVESLVQIMSDPNYLHFTVKTLLGIELLPYQMVVLETLWTKQLPLLIACRGGGKSFLLGIYVLLRLILQPGVRVIIVGAGFRQARIISEYMIRIWENSHILRDICGGKNDGPRTQIDRVEFRIGSSIALMVPLRRRVKNPRSSCKRSHSRRNQQYSNRGIQRCRSKLRHCSNGSCTKS